MLDGNPVNGFCIVSVYYCSPSGVTADQTAPSGFVNAVSNPGGCDYNACMGTSCGPGRGARQTAGTAS